MTTLKEICIADAYEVQTPVFSDNRGEFEVSWESTDSVFSGLGFMPKNMHHARNNSAHTLRGLHYQIRPFQQNKLVSCVSGSIWDVMVDIRPESPSYGLWHGTHLAAKTGNRVFVPAGCAHGYVSLEADSVVSYLIDSDYQPEASRVLHWNDSAIAIKWPERKMIMSEKTHQHQVWTSANISHRCIGLYRTLGGRSTEPI